MTCLECATDVRVLALLLTVLAAGCAKHDGVTRIQLWHQMQPDDRAVLERVIDAYDQRDSTVLVEVIYKETEELRSNYQSAALAGMGPDLVYGPSDQVGPLATMQFVRPLDEYFSTDELAGLDERAVVKFKDQTYQLADRIGNHLALVYNKSLMPVPPANTDELIAMGQELTKDLNGDGVTDQWGLVWNFTEPFFHSVAVGVWRMGAGRQRTSDAKHTFGNQRVSIRTFAA